MAFLDFFRRGVKTGGGGPNKKTILIALPRTNNTQTTPGQFCELLAAALWDQDGEDVYMCSHYVIFGWASRMGFSRVVAKSIERTVSSAHVRLDSGVGGMTRIDSRIDFSPLTIQQTRDSPSLWGRRRRRQNAMSLLLLPLFLLMELPSPPLKPSRDLLTPPWQPGKSHSGGNLF